jgi:hypothetical protein
MPQYTFTATPVGGGPSVIVSSIDPDVRLYGLLPNTEASSGLRVVCFQGVLVHWMHAINWLFGTT